jgi:hypothetical protein
MRILVAFLVPAVLFAGNNAPSAITFNKQVLPVLQKRCQECHRSGEAAPFSMLTYTDARPWAKAIKEAVLTKKMPPWFADPAYGRFSNDRRLTPDEVTTLVSWVDQGALEGDSKDAPASLVFTEGWTIGKPDVIFETPVDYVVPAKGTIEYTYFLLPKAFSEDKANAPKSSGPREPRIVTRIAHTNTPSTPPKLYAASPVLAVARFSPRAVSIAGSHQNAR